jgi:hypothetical protein
MADRNGYIGRAPGDSSVTVARQTFTPTGITTDFTFASGYVPGYFDLFINGAKQIEVSDYTATDGSTFSVLNGGAQNGDVLEGVAYKAFNAATVTNAADLTVSGNLTVNGSATFLGAGTSVAFATTSYNLAGTPDLTINNLVGVAATFSGKVSYEDVENIDSVGIVTARSGVDVLAGGINVVGGGLTVTGVSTFFSDSEFRGDVQFGAAGVAGSVTSSGDAVFVGLVTAANVSVSSSVTAATFYGSGANLTNLPAGGDSLDITASLFI